MKKKIVISMLALMMLITAASCGEKSKPGSALVDTESTPTASANIEGNTTTDTSSASQSAPVGNEQEQLEHFAEDADKKIDMNKLEGTKAKTDKSGKQGDGTMTTCKVAIDEVKLSQIDGSNVIFVQYDFKNTSSSSLNFSGEVYAEVYQDGLELNPAVFPDTIEGFSPETVVQKVEPGDSIKVQKAYATSDTSTPIEVYVKDSYDSTGQNYLSQVFQLN